MKPEIRSHREQFCFRVRGWLFLASFVGPHFAGRVCVARVSLHCFSLAAGAASPSTTMQGEREAMPPGHVSGAEAAAMAQGTVVQPQAQVVQPAAVTVVQPTVVQPQQPLGQVVYQQQQPVQPVGQVVYQQQQPPAVVVQQPTHAGPHQEKFIGIATVSIAALLCVCGCWPCAWIPFVAPCDERSVYPPQQQQTSTVVVQQQPKQY